MRVSILTTVLADGVLGVFIRVFFHVGFAFIAQSSFPSYSKTICGSNEIIFLGSLGFGNGTEGDVVQLDMNGD
jgi:hypothetical protein